jgi:2,3-bisphosphoglycerate-dependent phosphoglycerate mutase
MRVFLLRHAESADPTIFHGAESDVGLSELGQRQARTVARYLATVSPRRLVSSAMLRARDTATPIARACGLDIHIEPALHERRVGALSGTPTGGSEGVWPDTLARWIAGDTDFAPPGAESYEDIRGRVLPVWHRLTANDNDASLVVVAHGIVCKVLLLSLLTGYTSADWHQLGPIPNVGITELTGNATGWQAIRINQVLPMSVD